MSSASADRMAGSTSGSIRVAACFAVATAYFWAAKLGLLLATVHGNVSPVWAASGVATGFLVLGGRKLWPGVLFGAFAANAVSALPLSAAFAMAAGSTLEALAACWLLDFSRRKGSCLGAIEQPTGILAAALLAPLLSAFIGVFTLYQLDYASSSTLPYSFGTWWGGDALGILLLFPCLLSLAEAKDRLRSELHLADMLKSLTLVSLCLLICGLSFLTNEGAGFLFVLFPLILLSYVWFGDLGGRLLVVLVSASAVTATYWGHGPFVSITLGRSLLNLQFFMGAFGVLSLFVGRLRASQRQWLPYLVLLVGWSISGWLFASLQEARNHQDSLRFRSLISDFEGLLQRNISRYRDALMTGSAFASSLEAPETRDWAHFGASMQFEQRYPGLLCVGYAKAVPADSLNSFMAELAKQHGRPVQHGVFTGSMPAVNPCGVIHDHIIVQHVYPQDGSQAALGLDFATEPQRRSTALRACELGDVRMTSRLNLSLEGFRKNGFVLFAPVFHGITNLDTAQRRREQVRGWVYAVLQIDDLIRHSISGRTQEAEVACFDGRHNARRLLIFASAPTAADTVGFELRTEIDFFGHALTLGWNRGPEFPETDRFAPALAASCFAFVSFLLATLVGNLLSARQRALAMVQERTQELEVTNQRLLLEVGERQKAEAWLRETNILQRAILDAANYTIIATDAEGVIRSMNSAGERLLGYPQAELIGLRTLDHLHLKSELSERAFALTKELGENVEVGFPVLVAKAKMGEVDEREWTYVRKDGSSFPVMLQVAALRNVEGRITGFLGIGQDLSARREAEARLRLFAEHAPAAVAMFDREMRYMVASRQWLRDNKVEGQNLLGRCHYDVFPKLPERWKAIYRRCLDGAVEFNASDCFEYADGSIQWLQWEVRPWYLASGVVGGIVVFTLDISHRHDLETNLETARDEALEASRLKSEFLATMSHEIRTPMNGIIGMSGMLMQSNLEQKQREMAEVISRSAENLLLIINDILDFSKIEAGRLRIEAGDFNLRDSIEETLALLAPDAHRKGLQLVCDIDPQLATGLHGDSGRIQQIITNLCANAIKFTEHGEVMLRARPLRVTPSELSFRVEVHDTGVGVPESARGRLFKPFVQADGSSTRRFGGTGLGLAICSRLTSLMGGHIGYESREGVGSEFWFELFLPRSSSPVLEIPALFPAGAKVLVVDDYATNRSILLRQLGTLGLPASEAADAQGALELLRNASAQGAPFSLVILDWNMPGQDGLALARYIRADQNITKTELIVLASSSPVLGQDVLGEVGFSSVLTKPVRENQLRRALLRAHGQSEPVIYSPLVEKPEQALKLLMAEDNATNQIVARMILEQMGHSITIVDDGLAALELLARDRFDAVLMDCQMPVLDGFETTRRIRAGKHAGIPSRIPIIALTAYAMPEDRARAISAGMDDYVAKPISMDSLQAAFIRCGLQRKIRELHEEHRSQAQPQALQAGEVASVFDKERQTVLGAIKDAQGVSLWTKALELFVKEGSPRLEKLRDSISGQKTEEARILAHTLAGSAANIGASELRLVAGQLERMILAENWTDARASELLLREAWKRLLAEIRAD